MSQPGYRIVTGRRDITPTLDGRLERLTLTDTRGGEADQLDLSLSDHDGRLALPRKGTALHLDLGWPAEGLVNRGRFIVDEITYGGTPDVITVRARSADLTSELAVKRTTSWHGETVGAIVTTIAERHGLTPAVGTALADIVIEHIDQTNESDISFLSRLGDRYDAIATVKAARLLFMRAGEGETASGTRIPAITLTRADGDRHRLTERERDHYTGVRAHWIDIRGATEQSVVVGTEERLKTLRTTYGRRDDALAAARAEYRRIRRGAATFGLTLATGRADLYPETPVILRGFKRGIDQREWLIKEARHSLGDSGYTTSIDCETRGEDSP